VAAVNTSYGLLYNRLEDRRLGIVFGDRYGRYAEEVPGIVPVAIRSGARPSAVYSPAQAEPTALPPEVA
jgi:hypothetical protein